MFHFSYTEKKYRGSQNVETNLWRRWGECRNMTSLQVNTRELIRKKRKCFECSGLITLVNKNKNTKTRKLKIWRKDKRSYSFCCYCSDFWEREWRRREREWRFISRHFSQSKNKRDVWRFWNKANPLVVAQKKRPLVMKRTKV